MVSKNPNHKLAGRTLWIPRMTYVGARAMAAVFRSIGIDAAVTPASNEQTLELFSQLIKSGQAWTLQGCYGRQAMAFIRAGYISKTGELLRGKDGKG